MTSLTRRSASLYLFTSALTFAASGDDINLFRIALPSVFAYAPVGSCPMDDENSDFVLSSSASKVKNHEVGEWATVGGTSTARSVIPDAFVAPFLIDSFESHLFCRDSAPIPLRC
jgi:hypothetical protein